MASVRIDRLELKPVVLLERARRVEAQPGEAVAVARHLLDRADQGPEVPQGLRVDRRIALPPAVEVELRRAAREDRLQVGGRHAGLRAVEDVAVVARHGGDVERRLHASLDLQRGDARLDELSRVLAKPQVLHGEGIEEGGGVVRDERGIRDVRPRIKRSLSNHTSSFFLLPFYFSPTAIRALAAVAAAALLHRAEEAEPGNRVAQGPVDEDLELQFGTSVGGDLARAAALGDRRDLGERELAREDDAAEAEFLQREDAFEVVRDELGRGVKLQVREVLAHEPRDAEILHDDAVRTELLQPRQRLDGALDQVFVDERVEGDVDAVERGNRERGTGNRERGTGNGERGMGGVGEGDELGELVYGEVLRERARGEVREAAVDGVRARFERREGGREVAGRGEEFRGH